MNKIVKSGVEYILERVDVDGLREAEVLVTGGAGFLGSWLIDSMVAAGARVTCIDDISSGSRENVQHLMGDPRFKFIVGDVCGVELKGKYDYIVHMASIPSPEDYVRRPVEAMLPNSLGLLNVLRYAYKTGARVLFTSTSEVYGNPEVVPTPESYWGRVNPIGLRSPYDESKRFGEALCMAYLREYDTDVRVARIFNTYGPRLDFKSSYARVITRFIAQAFRGEPITVHGDGRQTRSFCYVADVVVCLLRMLLNDNVKGEVVNVGSPHEVQIIELAKLIKKLANSNSQIVFTTPRPEDPKRRAPDISKAKSLLNWMPEIDLEQGLKLTIEWFEEVLR